MTGASPRWIRKTRRSADDAVGRDFYGKHLYDSRKESEEEKVMVILGIIIAGMAGYLVYALMYPEKL